MKRIAIAALFVGISIAACGGATSSDVFQPGSSSSSASSSSSSSSGSGGGGRGEPRECTGIGCVDGLTLTLKAPAGWKAGNYTFTIEVDGHEQTCEGALPLPPCGTSSLRCKQEDKTILAIIGESGCALPASQHAFSDIRIDATPAEVKVHIARDGLVLADQKFEPIYVTSQPNGPGCEPICKTASGTVTLQAQ